MPVLISGCDVGCGSAVGGEEGGGGQLGLGGAVTGAVEQGGGGHGAGNNFSILISCLK